MPDLNPQLMMGSRIVSITWSVILTIDYDHLTKQTLVIVVFGDSVRCVENLVKEPTNWWQKFRTGASEHGSGQICM